MTPSSHRPPSWPCSCLTHPIPTSGTHVRGSGPCTVGLGPRHRASRPAGRVLPWDPQVPEGLPERSLVPTGAFSHRSPPSLLTKTQDTGGVEGHGRPVQVRAVLVLGWQDRPCGSGSEQERRVEGPVCGLTGRKWAGAQAQLYLPPLDHRKALVSGRHF